MKAAQKLKIGGHAEEQPVGRGRHDVFLAEQFQPVGRRLQPAKTAAHAGRSQAVLDAAGNLPFHPGVDRHAGHDQGQDQRNLDQAPHQVDDPAMLGHPVEAVDVFQVIDQRLSHVQQSSNLKLTNLKQS